MISTGGCGTASKSGVISASIAARCPRISCSRASAALSPANNARSADAASTGRSGIGTAPASSTCRVLAPWALNTRSRKSAAASSVPAASRAATRCPDTNTSPSRRSAEQRAVGRSMVRPHRARAIPNAACCVPGTTVGGDRQPCASRCHPDASRPASARPSVRAALAASPTARAVAGSGTGIG